jgi:hypothetical protein
VRSICEKLWPAALTKTNRENKNVKCNISIYLLEWEVHKMVPDCEHLMVAIKYLLQYLFTNYITQFDLSILLIKCLPFSNICLATFVNFVLECRKMVSFLANFVNFWVLIFEPNNNFASRCKLKWQTILLFL